MVPDSSISLRCFWTTSTRGRGTNLNHSLKGVSSVTLIVCLVEWVQPNSAGSNEKTTWYLAKSQWAASASSWGHEVSPLRSNSSNSLPCLCLVVKLGRWGFWGPSSPLAPWSPVVFLALQSWPMSWPLKSFFGAFEGRPYCTLPPQLHSCYLFCNSVYVFWTVRPWAREPSLVHSAWVMTLMHSPV